MSTSRHTATFGAGCFWGVEAAFSEMDGVVATEVGYAGGTTENPGYRDVCSGDTGHAEVVRLTYDEAKLSYAELLDAFFGMHDPTQRNRQGPDAGTQYRSVIFYHSPAQRAAAEAALAAMAKSGRNTRPIATQIEPATSYFRAEEYHQRYFAKQGRAGCRLPV